MHKRNLIRSNMDLLNATSDLVKTIKKLALWNESSAELQDYETLNNAIQSGKKDEAIKFFNEMLSDKTIDYDILIKALKCGYTDVAYFLLEEDCAVNVISFVPSFTPLHLAVKLGNAQLVKKLLEKGASISNVNSNRDSPLHLAYKDAFISEDNELVDLLLSHIEETSSYINIKNQHGLSHLHIAAAKGNAQLVKKFKEAGASLLDSVYDDSPTHANYAALEFACDAKCLDTIKICRQWFPDKIQMAILVGEMLLMKESRYKASHLLNYLDNPYRFVIKMCHKFGEDYDQLSDFHRACLEGKLKSVKTFLDGGEDVNAVMSRNAEFTPLYTALHFALESENQRYEKVTLLLDRDADVYKRNGFCMTALHLAMYTHNWENSPEDDQSTLELLYSTVEDKEANPMDCNGLTYFHIAVVVGDLDLVKHLLDSGVDVNQRLLSDLRDFSDYAPLHFAARYDREDLAKLLIDRGAEMNPEKGESPLQIALEAGCYRVIELLLEHDADVKVVKSGKKMTTLHLLVECYIEKGCGTDEALREKEKLIGFVEKLVELGVDVNAKDLDGFTALHDACWNMYNGIWLIERLLAVGADINLKNNQGETPLDVARRCTDQGTYDDFLLLYHHVRRLEALGLEVDVSNRAFCEMLMERKEVWRNNDDWKIVEDMYSDETFARKDRERLEEIEKLKRDVIAEGVSLYDYLRMGAEQVAGYVENERVREIVEGDAEVDYEVYGYLVSVQYRKGLDWLVARV